jgi:hypothetical protein
MKIEFTIEQLSILDKALQQLPYVVVAPLINDINKQIVEQQKIMDTPIEVDALTPKTLQQNGE